MQRKTFSWKIFWYHAWQYSLVLWVLLLPWQTHYVLQLGTNDYSTLKLYSFNLWWIVVAMTFVGYWYTHKNLKVDWIWFWLGMAVLAVTAVAGYWADNRDVSFYYWWQIAQAVSLGWMIVMAQTKKEPLLVAFLSTGVIETIWLAWQWLTQTVSANSWLGIAQQLPANSGVAVVLSNTGRWLRPYGTFPHPNIAAGWLVLCILSSYWLWLVLPKLWQKKLVFMASVVSMIGLLLTFSRSALFVWFVCSLVLVVTHWKKLWPLLSGTLCTGVITIALLAPLWFSRLQANDYVERISISERSAQLSEAWSVITTYWPRGIGLGNYTLWLGNSLGTAVEPVHMIILLWLAELGGIGVIVMCIWLVAAFQQARWRLPAVLALNLLPIACCLLAIFDHYLWTIPSLLFIWFAIIGLQRSYNRHII